MFHQWWRFIIIFCGGIALMFHPASSDAGCATNDLERIAARYLKATARIERVESFEGGDNESFGAGVFYTSTKAITNAHVIGLLPDNAEHFKKVYTDADLQNITLWVKFGGKKYEAHVVGRDPTMDLAVVESNETIPGVEPAALGDSDAVAVGECVAAIGMPQGLDNTVTTGIVSAKNRVLGHGNSFFEDAIQTDAAINSGNSGGLLVSLKTENVIGIVESTVANAEGLSFAIPINLFRNIEHDLRGTVQRSWIGVKTPHKIEETPGFLGLAEIFQYTHINSLARLKRIKKAVSGERGVLINEIMPILDRPYLESYSLERKDWDAVAIMDIRTPAFQAGLAIGDVVTTINGVHIGNRRQFLWAIVMAKPHEPITIHVLRFVEDKVEEYDITVTPIVRNLEGIAAGYF